MKTIHDLDVKGKQVLVRVDFNVRLDKNFNITDDTRMQKALPTINNLLVRGASVILASHLGRPQKDKNEDGSIKVKKYTLNHLVEHLAELTDAEIVFADDCVGGETELKAERLEEEPDSAANLEMLFARVQAGEEEELRLIIKADVQGSLEPIINSVKDMKSGGEQDIGVKVIYSGTGIVTNDDVNLASTTNSIILGFNVGPDSGARRLAASEGVSIRKYNIIYHLIDGTGLRLGTLIILQHPFQVFCQSLLFSSQSLHFFAHTLGGFATFHHLLHELLRHHIHHHLLFTHLLHLLHK
jgi:hypothetical protein